MGMTINKHKENLLYIMESMPDDACGDWRDSLAYAINTMQKYQKIKQLLNVVSRVDGTDYYTYDYEARIKDIMEVVEDGNDNN